MKRIFTIVAVLLIAMQIASAQKSQIDESLKNELKSIRREQQNPVNALIAALPLGEPDSFGKNAKFLGTATTGVVYVYYSCDPQVLQADLQLTLGADDRCLAHTPGAATSRGTFDDIGRITLPGRSADNVVYFIVNNTIDNEFQNDTSSGMPAFFTYVPRLTIESPALNNPNAVDPTTGLPLNGVLTVNVGGTKLFQRTIPANDFEFAFDNFSTAATRGFARSYFADLGLPSSVINNLYRQPMTIKLGMRVVVRGQYFGQYLYTLRLMGN